MKPLEYRNIDLILFIVFLVITSLGLIFLKMIPFQSEMLSFLKDTLGNIGGVLAASSLFICYQNYDKISSRIIVIASVSVGFIIYELIQKFISWATFDIRDILATFIGALIAILVNIIVIKLFVTKSNG
jgi:Co/Zn/Cd efflux system component